MKLRPCTREEVEAIGGPDEALKYFWFGPAGGPLREPVDIHIRRNGIEICPKQDVGFPLQNGDRIKVHSAYRGC